MNLKKTSQPIAHIISSNDTLSDEHVLPGSYAQLRPIFTPSTPTRIVKRTETTTYRHTTSSDGNGKLNPQACEFFNATKQQQQYYRTDNVVHEKSKYFFSAENQRKRFHEESTFDRGNFNEPAALPVMNKKSFFTSRK